QAMVGQDPARFRRSTTATRFRCEASDQAKDLALPLPSTTTSYSSGCDTFFPLRVNSSRYFHALAATISITTRNSGRPRRCSASTTRPPTPPTRPAAPVTRMGCVIVFPFDFARLFRWPCRTTDTPWPSCPLLTRFPGLAERPERNPEQGQILDEELPRERRQGGEAAETRLPDARRRDQEGQGREEHPDRQGAPEGGSPRPERAGGDEHCDGDLAAPQHAR